MLKYYNITIREQYSQNYMNNSEISKSKTKLSPWGWIPGLYVAEGLPYFAVNVITVLMYTKMNIPLEQMAYYTGWLYLPWVIKPFWSPFVDIIRTKRWWIIMLQFGLAITMAGVAFLLPTSFFFSATLAVFWLMAFFSATYDIAADGYYMLALTAHEQAAYVGIRSTFYRIASVIGQGALVVLAGVIETHTGNIPFSWSVVFATLSIFFFLVAIYDIRMLPHPITDIPRKEQTASDLARNFGLTFVQFFRKPNIVSALLFMLLYRLPEAMLIKIVQPFLIATRAEGGLGLTTSEVGFVNGTVGVIGLLAGGIIGGLCIAKSGLKNMLWPMALSLTLPCGIYCWLGMCQPDSFFAINSGIFIEQFGYGFGFTAYMLYLIYFSQGENKTSHYAFCTAFMALGMMLPGMMSGWIFRVIENFNLFGLTGPQGYINFFWWIMLSSLATFAACSLVRIEPGFGRKK